MFEFTKMSSSSSTQMAIFVIIAILTEYILASPIAPKVTFYTDRDYKGSYGENIVKADAGCIQAQPVNGEWSSVKTEPEGLCLELYDNLGCQKVETAKKVKGSLQSFEEKLNDKIIAFKICGS